MRDEDTAKLLAEREAQEQRAQAEQLEKRKEQERIYLDFKAKQQIQSDALKKLDNEQLRLDALLAEKRKMLLDAQRQLVSLKGRIQHFKLQPLPSKSDLAHGSEAHSKKSMGLASPVNGVSSVEGSQGNRGDPLGLKNRKTNRRKLEPISSTAAKKSSLHGNARLNESVEKMSEPHSLQQKKLSHSRRSSEKPSTFISQQQVQQSEQSGVRDSREGSASQPMPLKAKMSMHESAGVNLPPTSSLGHQSNSVGQQSQEIQPGQAESPVPAP